MTHFTRNHRINRTQFSRTLLCLWLALSLTLMASLSGAMQMQCLDGTICPDGSMAQVTVVPSTHSVAPDLSAKRACPACGTQFAVVSHLAFGTQIAAQSQCVLRVNGTTNVMFPQRTFDVAPNALLPETPRFSTVSEAVVALSFAEPSVFLPPESVRLHSGRAPPVFLCV